MNFYIQIIVISSVWLYSDGNNIIIIIIIIIGFWF